MEDGTDGAASRSTKRRRSELEGPSPLGRRKTACQTCRNRKVKCDLKRPVCSLCDAAGNTCIYLTEPPKQTQVLRRQIPISSNKLHRLESVAEALTGRLDHVTQQLDDLKAALESRDHTQTRPSPISPVVSSHLTSPPINQPPVYEPSRDFLHIPPHRTTADTVLTWPIFQGRFEPNYLVQPLLSDPEVADPHPYAETGPERDNYSLKNTVGPFDDEKIPALVDSFLLNVHTKNPVLDVDALIQKSRQASIHGLGWDAWSCCILIACALGAIAKPFRDSPSSPRVASLQELQMGEQCFVLACRRLGLLKQTMLAAQCHFFAGVYLMYTLRPMLSWQHFHQAAITYQLYLKTNGRILDNFTVLEQSHAHLQPGSAAYRKQARLEQRLYWSCFKSESEFRVELPLPQSEIADYEFPRLFPSPPSPPSPAPYVAIGGEPGISIDAATYPHDPMLNSDGTVRQTESWYYYLTEVALRRIGNRIINTFFTGNRDGWMTIEPYLDIAVEFETQVSSWYANLPSAMQRYERNSTIRAPRRESVAGIEIDAVSQELSWATENRLLEMRSWLYQPFLYHLVHAKPQRLSSQPLASPTDYARSVRSTSLGPESAGVLWSLIRRGIECNMTILETRSLPHRHHGLWYDLRAIMCASLILLAIVQSGNIDLIPGGLEALVGTSGEHTASETLQRRATSTGSSDVQPLTLIGGKFGRVLDQLRFWSNEAPDMARHASTLERLIFEIMG